MGKKKNIVSRAKGGLFLSLALMLGLGWGSAAYTVFAGNAEKKQEEIIRAADAFLADRLYVRAAAKYKEGLSAYTTEKNPVYEAELLNIYKEAGMNEEYESLLDNRIKSGNAAAGEYLERAGLYLAEGAVNRAIPVLQEGIRLYADPELEALYESVAYAYSPLTTNYTEVGIPSEDWYLPAFNGDLWGYIGDNGKTILDFAYEEATCFSGNYAVVKLDGVYTLIDKNGYWNAVDKNGLEAVTAISGTKIVGKKDGKYRIYSNTFVPLSEEAYDQVYLNDNGLILVQKDGMWAVLDSGLKEVTGYEFTDMAVNSRGQVYSGNYAVAADGNGYYLIDREGNACFDARFPDAMGMEGGFFAVADENGKWGFADEKAQLVVECRYEDARSFSDGLAAVKEAGSWGYINRYGTMMIEPQFEGAGPFFEGKALAADDMGNYKILELKYFGLFE